MEKLTDEYLDMQAAAHRRALQALSAAHAGELAGQAQAHRQQVEELKMELAEQEREKLRLIEETYRWSAAVKNLESERIAK